MEEEYGAGRLESIYWANRTAFLSELARILQHHLETFAQGVPFANDRTLVMLRRL